MLHSKYFLPLTAACWCVCLAGCDTPMTDPDGPTFQAAQPADARQTRIGTIDVARIYSLTGLQNQRNAKIRELNQKRVALDKEHNEAMQSKITEFGGDAGKLTENQRQELQQMQSAWVAARRDNTAEAQQVMRETDQFLNNLYNQQTSEPIRKVAENRGLDVVLVMQRNLFAYVNPEVDITDDVIKQLDLSAAPTGSTPAITDLLPQEEAPAAPQQPAADPAKDEAAADATGKEEPAKEEAAKEATAKEEPMKDEPVKEEPVKEAAQEEPVKEQPTAADRPTAPTSRPEEGASGDDAPSPGTTPAKTPVVDGEP